jgi:hypothetical protein
MFPKNYLIQRTWFHILSWYAWLVAWKSQSADNKKKSFKVIKISTLTCDIITKYDRYSEKLIQLQFAFRYQWYRRNATCFYCPRETFSADEANGLDRVGARWRAPNAPVSLDQRQEDRKRSATVWQDRVYRGDTDHMATNKDSIRQEDVDDASWTRSVSEIMSK